MSAPLFSFVPSNRFSGKLAAIGLSSMLAVAPVWGQEKPVPANKLFPQETQALFSLPDSEAFQNALASTQLGRLAEDSKLVDFWVTQQKEIQDRFSEAGLQLSLEIDDLKQISGGQTSLGWISRPKVTDKPFSVALIIDVVDRTSAAQTFLQRIDVALKAKNAVFKSIVVAGVTVSKYSLPKLAGDVRVSESFYCYSKDQLFMTDDLITMTDLLAGQMGNNKDSLAESQLYKRVQSKIAQPNDPPEVEYFLRPIGFANLLRSISGKPPKNQSDILLILNKQGFGDLECVAGNVQIATESFDFVHHGYLIGKKPASTSVQILDLPNLPKLDPPDWVNKESASVLSFSWNIKEAFPKFEGIVDSFASPGTFDDMIDGLKLDTQGPQIDILVDVLPYLSTEFHVVTEIALPISPDSKRSMVILKLNDPTKKLPKVLDRYGKGEPDSQPIDFEGSRIWSFENKDEPEIELDFGTKSKDKKANAESDESEPLLDKWAITIFGEHFIFASDVEMIKDAILRAKNGGQRAAFEKEADVAKVLSVLKGLPGGDGLSMKQITRADRSFEMQYELFRQDILPESRSMMATILDKILKPKDSKQAQVQRVKGDKLPPFNTIREYFTPSGGVVRTEDEGWSLKSFILKKAK